MNPAVPFAKVVRIVLVVSSSLIVNEESDTVSSPVICEVKMVERSGTGIGELDNWKPEIPPILAVRFVPAEISGAVGAAGFATAGRNLISETPLRKNFAMFYSLSLVVVDLIASANWVILSNLVGSTPLSRAS